MEKSQISVCPSISHAGSLVQSLPRPPFFTNLEKMVCVSNTLRSPYSLTKIALIFGAESVANALFPVLRAFGFGISRTMLEQKYSGLMTFKSGSFRSLLSCVECESGGLNFVHCGMPGQQRDFGSLAGAA